MKTNPMPRRLPYDLVDGVLLALIAVTLLLPGLWLLLFYGDWPDVVPTHYNFVGEADGWGGKSTYFLLYAIDLGVVLLMVALNHFPHTWNQPSWLNEANAWATARFLRRFMEGAALFCGLIFLPFFLGAPALPRWVGLTVVILAILCGPVLLVVYFLGSRDLRR